jgi:hypothetical protein
MGRRRVENARVARASETREEAGKRAPGAVWVVKRAAGTMLLVGGRKEATPLEQVEVAVSVAS